MSFIDELRAAGTPQHTSRYDQIAQLVKKDLSLFQGECRKVAAKHRISGFLHKYTDDGYAEVELVPQLPTVNIKEANQKLKKTRGTKFPYVSPWYDGQHIYAGYTLPSQWGADDAETYCSLFRDELQKIGFTSYHVQIHRVPNIWIKKCYSSFLGITQLEEKTDGYLYAVKLEATW